MFFYYLGLWILSNLWTTKAADQDLNPRPSCCEPTALFANQPSNQIAWWGNSESIIIHLPHNRSVIPQSCGLLIRITCTRCCKSDRAAPCLQLFFHNLCFVRYFILWICLFIDNYIQLYRRPHKIFISTSLQLLSVFSLILWSVKSKTNFSQ